MLDDAIMLNMQSIQDNDRLSLIPSASLGSYLTGLSSKFIAQNGTPLLNFENPALQNLKRMNAALLPASAKPHEQQSVLSFQWQYRSSP